MKLFIDCDPGVDDSLAILFALCRKDVEVVGISTAVGNTSAKQGACNALGLLKLAGREHQIPVCIGSEEPLCGTNSHFPVFIHGANGIGNAALPISDQKPVPMDVCDFMYEIACQHAGEVVLVTLGRMTNVAKVLAKYPDYSSKIKRVVSMGGAVYSHGNVAPCVEANIGGDPEAADIAVQADWDMTMVGLDVTLKTHLTRADVDKLKRCCAEDKKEMVEFISDALTYYMDGSRRQNFTMEYSPLHDPLAMVVAVDPSVVETRKMVTRIECGGTYCRGKVVVDLREQPIRGNFVSHCLHVNDRKALNVFFAAFQS